MKNKYIKLNNKKVPLTTFDASYDSTRNLQNAGLLLNDGVVLVDFDNDNADEAAIIQHLAEKHPTQTVRTSRGIHFYYSKPLGATIKSTSDKITVGGFQVDYKTGSKSYAVVKLNNLDRIGSTELKLNDLPPLPTICLPLANVSNLTGMKEGSGRNDAVFYHLRCIREQYDDVDIAEIASFINNVCLGNPFDGRELSGIINSVEKLKIKPRHVDVMVLADVLVERLDICVYKGRIYFRSGSKYITGDYELSKAANDVQRLKQPQYKELVYQLKNRGRSVADDSKFEIALPNGVLRNGIIEHTEHGFTPFYLNVDYDPKAYDPVVDKFLNDITCSRKELRTNLEEILGHCLMTFGFPHKVFFLLGKGRNGKSTFLEMINAFAGELAGSVGLTGFDDPTSLASLIGKIVNCSDDIDSERIDRTKYFKSISAGNSISIRPIYSEPISFRNTATLIVNANALPTFADKSLGLYERLFIIPFDLDLRREDIDPYLIDNLSSKNAKSYILNLAIAGAKRIAANGKISDNEYTKKAMKKYKNDTDSMGAFLDTHTVRDGDWLDHTYRLYQDYCTKNDTQRIDKNVFSRRLKSYGYETTNVKRDGSKPTAYNRDRQIFST